MKRIKTHTVTKIIHLKKLLFPLICFFFILLLIMFSQTAVNSARKGLNLWFNIVFPSLFPFFVASELLNGTGLVRAVGTMLEPIMRPLFNIPGCGSFAFAMGISSGYPVGARITSLLRKEALISKIEAERLLTFTNNSGPLFIIGAVSVGMFNLPQAGLLMLACHIASAVTVGCIFRFYGRGASRMEKDRRTHKSKKNVPPAFLPAKKASGLGKNLGEAVKNSVMTILSIGGYIVLFSVIIHMLIETGILRSLAELLALLLAPLDVHVEMIQAVLCGIFEITTGTNMAATSGADPVIRLTICSIIIGWAGLSVHAQVSSIVSETDIRIKPYIIGKLLQGLIAGIYTYAAFKVFGRITLGSMQVFAPFGDSIPLKWMDCFLNSLGYLVMCILGFIAVSFVLHVLIRHKITQKTV